MPPKRWLTIIITIIAIALIFLGIALVSYYVILPALEKEAISKLENTLIGTWQNETRNVTITFYQNKTYKTNNNNTIYTGTWRITNPIMHYVNVNWEGFSADYIFMLIKEKNQLALIGVNEPAGFVYLSKIS